MLIECYHAPLLYFAGTDPCAALDFLNFHFVCEGFFFSHIFSTFTQCGFWCISACQSSTLKLCESSTILLSTEYYYVFSRYIYEEGQIRPPSRHKVVSDKRDALLRLFRWRWRWRWRTLLFSQARLWQFHHVELPATVLHTLAPMATRVPKQQWEHSTTRRTHDNAIVRYAVQRCVCVTTISVEVLLASWARAWQSDKKLMLILQWPACTHTSADTHTIVLQFVVTSYTFLHVRANVLPL